MDQSILRKVAGKFATGVTVVNTIDDDGVIQGVTANSFVSISMSPPLVGFSLMESGLFLSLLGKGSKLGINILSSHQKSTSNRFAGINDESTDEDHFDIKNGHPILSGSIAWYAVEVEDLIPMGDHIFVLCKIIDLEAFDNEPLIYYSGYKSIGETI